MLNYLGEITIDRGANHSYNRYIDKFSEKELPRGLVPAAAGKPALFQIFFLAAEKENI